MAEIDSSRRSRKKQNTHRAILHNAKILFEQKGIGNVTIEQISESADVSRSTFFSHFASLDDLLREISDEEVNDVFSAVQKDEGDPTISALLR
ncbi:MAG: TetR/AcrR family transcriptional regulator, partial [Acutalibacteraceae bacterium]